MDLRVGQHFFVESPKAPRMTVDPYDSSTFQRFDSMSLPNILPPKERALLYTEDVVTIPSGVFGFIQLRSTWARLGLVAPPTVADPGFSGTLTLEVFNASNNSILVRPGDKIWSLNLVPAVNEPLYDGRYQGQIGLTMAKPLEKNV